LTGKLQPSESPSHCWWSVTPTQHVHAAYVPQIMLHVHTLHDFAKMNDSGYRNNNTTAMTEQY